RAGGPFVAINCSAIPETLMESEIFGRERGAFTGAAERRIGCFELSDSGTLLLDEIGEMPAPTQAKLLRVLEDRKVRRLGSKTETPIDVRVVAATNKDPEQAVGNGQLRQDLYFRLNVFHIHLPPLREHKEDIPLLVEHILREVNVKHGKHVRGIGAEVLDIFMWHTWPGNIRELRNALERAAIMCEKDLITRACLPSEFGKMAAKGTSDLSTIKVPVGTTVDAMERALILQTLRATGNNKTRAAEEIHDYVRHAFEISEGLRTQLRAAKENPLIYEVSITDSDGLVLASTDENLPGTFLPRRTPLVSQLVGRNLLHQMKVLFGPSKVFELDYPFSNLKEPFGEVRIAVASGLLLKEIQAGL